MQHNLLANFLLFHTTLPSDQWLRILQQISTYPLVRLPSYQFWYSHYRCKNEVKATFNFKQKVTKQQFDLLFIQNNQFAFVRNRQKNGLVGNTEGSFAFVDPSFLEMVKKDLLQGDKNLIEKKQVLLRGLHWQNYLIFYLQVPQDQFLIFIQEINALTIFTQQSQANQNRAYKQQDIRKTYEEVLKRLDMFFEPIMQQLVGDREWKERSQKYCKILVSMLQSFKELKKVIEVRQNYKDKRRTKLQYNFTAIMFNQLSSWLQKAEV